MFPGKAASAHSHGLKFSFAPRYKYLALKSHSYGPAQHGNTWWDFCYPFLRGEIPATENSYQSQLQLSLVQCRWHLPSLCSQLYLCLHTAICFRSRYFHLFSYPQISNHRNWSPTTEMPKATVRIDLYQRKRKIRSLRLLVEYSKDLDFRLRLPDVINTPASLFSFH